MWMNITKVSLNSKTNEMRPQIFSLLSIISSSKEIFKILESIGSITFKQNSSIDAHFTNIILIKNNTN